MNEQHESGQARIARTNLKKEIESSAFKSIQAGKRTLVWKESLNRLFEAHPEWAQNLNFKSLFSHLSKVLIWLIVFGIDYLFMRPLSVYIAHLLNTGTIGKEIIAVIVPLVVIGLETIIGALCQKARWDAEQTYDTSKLFAWKILTVVMLVLPTLLVLSMIFTSGDYNFGMICLYIVFGVLSTVGHFIILKLEGLKEAGAYLLFRFRLIIIRTRLKRADNKLNKRVEVFRDHFLRYLDYIDYQQGMEIPDNFSLAVKWLANHYIAPDIFPEAYKHDFSNFGKTDNNNSDNN